MKKSVEHDDKGEVVLKLGAEGGELVIRRTRSTDGKEKFILISDESTLADFLDDIDPTNLVNVFPTVNTFEEAINQMDRFPWRELYLVYVHPDYENKVLGEMRKTNKKGFFR